MKLVLTEEILTKAYQCTYAKCSSTKRIVYILKDWEQEQAKALIDISTLIEAMKAPDANMRLNAAEALGCLEWQIHQLHSASLRNSPNWQDAAVTVRIVTVKRVRPASLSSDVLCTEEAK